MVADRVVKTLVDSLVGYSLYKFLLTYMSSTISSKFLCGIGGITIAALVTAQQALAQNFNDVQGYWAEPYVTTLAGRKIIGGFPDGTFKPNAEITRAQFAAIAVKALDLPTASSGRSFVDVPSGYWASGAISSVSNSGLVTGFPDGSFRPEAKITRAQALVVLAKALQGSANPAALNRYVDRQAVPEWATESVSKAANARIIVNFPDPTRIRPNDVATRGEVAALMYQTLSRLGRNLPPLSIGLLDGSPVAIEPPPNSSSLQIDRVDFNNENRQFLTGGDELTVRVAGTAKANATFAIEGITRDIPLREVENGIYEGRYTVRRNDNQSNAKIIATLSMPRTTPVTREASQTITIDGAAPEIKDLQPQNRTRVTNRQTDISAVFDDGNGIGVDPRTIKLFVNGVDVTSQSSVNQNFVSYRPTQSLPGNSVNVDVRVADRAGNQTTRSWAFGFDNGNTGNPPNPSGSNSVPRILNFANNDTISLPVQLTGRTAPNARVQIVAESLTSIGGVVDATQPLLNTVIQADQNGDFSFGLRPASFNPPSGSRYRIRMRSIDPQTNTMQASELLLLQR